MKQDDKLYNELSSDHMEIYREKAAKQAKTAMEHFKEIGKIVYLKASYQTIKRRIRNPQKRGLWPILSGLDR